MQNIPSLSVLQIEKCVFYDGQKCDFTSTPRPFHVLSYVNRGRAIFQNQYKTITLEEGDVFFIPMGEKYRSEWSGGEIVYCTSVFFAFESGKDPTAENAYRLCKLEGEMCEKFANAIKCLMSQKNKDVFYSYTSMSLFYSMCENLFENMEATPRRNNTAVIQNAIDHIERNFDSEISVRTLAELCNFSESRFHHVFKELMGITPIEYKHKVAVEHAVLYLGSEHGYTIEEVSDKCGFSSSIYFRRVFKKIMGRSPREYKKYGRI